MMTTDTVPKQSVRQWVTSSGPVTVAGAAKGAAMIAPNMGTMLAVIMTDAACRPNVVDGILRAAVDETFHCISVDGHTSTSDTVLLLANGASGVLADDGPAREQLQQAVSAVCQELSQMIVRDAEGAEHFVTIRVTGSRTEAEARCIARTVADSALVKTAIAGNDPNWGRIVSAAGYAGVEFAEEQVSLTLNGTLLYERGTPLAFDETTVSNSMKTGEILIELAFELGSSKACFWTSDLTAEYVRLNADYTT
jgi:glutamate N-acetyltransferase/amino-acid N-acetyltransferase